MTPDLTPLLLDEAAVARLMSCTRADVRRLVAQGILPAPVDLAGLTRWHAQAVREAVDRAFGRTSHHSSRNFGLAAVPSSSDLEGALGGWRERGRKRAA